MNRQTKNIERFITNIGILSIFMNISNCHQPTLRCLLSNDKIFAERLKVSPSLANHICAVHTHTASMKLENYINCYRLLQLKR